MDRMKCGQGRSWQCLLYCNNQRLETHLVVEPLADEMDANTRHDGGLVLEAHGGQVQTATTHLSSLIPTARQIQIHKRGRKMFTYLLP